MSWHSVVFSNGIEYLHEKFDTDSFVYRWLWTFANLLAENDLIHCRKLNSKRMSNHVCTLTFPSMGLIFRYLSCFPKVNKELR
jgi:hypothetical protein